MTDQPHTPYAPPVPEQVAPARPVPRTSVEKVHELLGHLPAMLGEMGPAAALALPILEPKLRGMIPADPAVLDGHLRDLATLVLSLVSDAGGHDAQG